MFAASLSVSWVLSPREAQPVGSYVSVAVQCQPEDKSGCSSRWRIIASGGIGISAVADIRMIGDLLFPRR
jgi:hypothetical protein